MKFAGRDIEVKTLTVADVKTILDHFEQMRKNGHGLSVVDMLMDDEVPAVAVTKASGLTMAELEGAVNPQDLRELFDAVRAANPFFLGMMERLIQGGRSALEKEPVAGSQQKSLSGQSVH